jgi:hypothetical protein
MKMQTFITEAGKLIITGDEAIAARTQAVDMEAANWTYTVKDPEDSAHPIPVVVDVSSHRKDLQALSEQFQRADFTKRPEEAAGYVRLKEAVIAAFDKTARGER